MFRKPLKILMVQTMNMNLGDSILADNDCYLMKKAMGFKRCDLLRYSISSRDFSQVRYVDAVVFAGGIIKCTNENFWQYMPEIIKEADKYNVPVFLSAIGVEKFYENDERSVALKAALNLPCVKGISVRDDVETLKRDYIENKDIKIYSVYDPAVWCADTYKKHLAKKPSHELVGLGITREKLFEDYGNPQIDRQFQLDLWKGIIQELDKRNVKWKVFTNGDTYDEIFAKEVLEFVGHGEKLTAPLDSQALVHDISTFTSVIAGRMHSNIVSFALSVPSIGFIWNQKLRFWGEKIGYPERFIECDNLTVDNVISAWEKARNEGCIVKKEFKNGVYLALKDFAKTIRHREKDTDKLPEIQNRLVAASLGGIEIRYKNTNSKQAYEYSTKLGYKNFHVDLRLTSDDKLVCVHRWHKETYRIMNHPKKLEDKPSAISYDEFMGCKYYNRFDTLDFDTLMSISEKDHRFILSVGKPKKEDFETMVKCISETIEKYDIDKEKIYIRLEQKRDIDYVIKNKINIKIIYYAVDKKTSEQETLEFLKSSLEYCKSKKIKYLYFNHNVYTQEFDNLCKEYGIKYCSSTCVLTDKAINNINNKAHFVFNQYYDVNYIRRLTK